MSTADLAETAPIGIMAPAEPEAGPGSFGHGGATGEAPDAAEAGGEDSAPQEPQASVQHYEDLCGQYSWKSPTEESEHTLRLQASGMFWHAAHRTGEMKRKIIEKGKPEDQAKTESVPVWELAESLGEWRILGNAPSSGSKAAVIELQCKNTRWASDHPVAPLMFRPTEDGQKNMDKMIDEGSMRLVYSLQTDEGEGGRKLEMLTGHQAADWSQALGSTHASMRAVQSAVQTLGFVRRYDHT